MQHKWSPRSHFCCFTCSLHDFRLKPKHNLLPFCVLARPPIFKSSVGTLWNASPFVPFPPPFGPIFGFLIGDSVSKARRRWYQLSSQLPPTAHCACGFSPQVPLWVWQSCSWWRSLSVTMTTTWTDTLAEKDIHIVIGPSAETTLQRLSLPHVMKLHCVLCPGCPFDSRRDARCLSKQQWTCCTPH